MLRICIVGAALLLSSPASAYIGPGAGISVLGSILGILVTIVVAIGAIVMWPLRKMLKKRRQAGGAEPSVESESSDPDAVPGERG